MASAALVLAASGDAAGATREGVMLGAKLFQSECAGCHGPRGDGQGVADPEMQPRPRDLTSGKYKLRSTWSRSPITDAELLHTLANGIPGTAMPSFRYLSEEDRRHLVEYLVSIAGLPAERPADSVDVPPEPPTTAALLAEGKTLYADLGCPACHGDGGRGDGAAGPYLKDEWGSKTPPRDLTREPMKGGNAARDLYLRFMVGMPGTPMPSYDDLITPEQTWALVKYVQSLASSPDPSPPAASAVERGQRLVAEKHCLACHSLALPPAAGGDPVRSGGDVGPPLDLMARLLDPAWAKRFLVEPRAHGKIYPAFPYRMPDLGLSGEQADDILAYLAVAAGGRGPAPSPSRPAIDDAVPSRGAALYRTACGSCHGFDGTAATAPTEQQGPDLSKAAERYDYDFTLDYVAQPRRFDPGAVMGPSALGPEALRAIADYIWSGGRAQPSARTPSS